MAEERATIITGITTDMAIPNEIPGARLVGVYFIARAFVCLLGLGAIIWGGSVLPLLWRQAPINRVTAEVLRGHSFPVQTLLQEAQKAEEADHSPFCNPTKLHNAVVLRLVILNDAMAASDSAKIGSAYSSLYDAARKALTCGPADSFVWLTLFWLDAGNNGLTATNVNYLRMSYNMAPNEGWIGQWRARLAFGVFDQLPADLANDALEEFTKLLDTGELYSQTAAIFQAAKPDAQKRIIEQLKTAKLVPRQNFARVLSDRGLDVAIPGVEGPTRPWH